MRKTMTRTLSILAVATLMLGACQQKKKEEVDPNAFKFFDSLEECEVLTFDNLEVIKEKEEEEVYMTLSEEVKSVHFNMEAYGDAWSEETKFKEECEANLTFYQEEYYEVEYDSEASISVLGTTYPERYGEVTKEKGVLLNNQFIACSESTSLTEEKLDVDWRKESKYFDDDTIRTHNLMEMFQSLFMNEPIGKLTNKTGEYWVYIDYRKYTESTTNYEGTVIKYQPIELTQTIAEVIDGRMTRCQLYQRVTIDKNLTTGQFLDEPRVAHEMRETFEFKYGDLDVSPNREQFILDLPDYVIHEDSYDFYGSVSSLSLDSNGTISSVDNTNYVYPSAKYTWLDSKHIQFDVELEMSAAGDGIGLQLEFEVDFRPFNVSTTDYFYPDFDLLPQLSEALGSGYPIKTNLGNSYLVLPGTATKLSFSVVVEYNDKSLSKVVVKDAVVE